MSEVCGAEKEVDFGIAVCEKEDCDGQHVSSTPAPGISYTWEEDDYETRAIDESTDVPAYEGQEVSKGGLLGGERVRKGGTREGMGSLYSLWVNSGTLVPGITYVWAYSVGALAALIDDKFAVLLIVAYIIFAIGTKFNQYKNE